MRCLLGHLGLGDAIIMSGMVRAMCEEEEVLYVAKKAYAPSLRTLFAGVPRLRFLFVDEWEDAVQRVRELSMPVVACGAFAGDPGWASLDPRSWARCFYAQVGMDPEIMYHRFRVERRREAEAEVLARVEGCVGPEFAVVHDDASRGLSLRVPPSVRVPVVHVDDLRIRRDNIFEYLAVFERATAVHAIDSCFLLMCDFVGLTLGPSARGKFYCHAYAKDPGMPELYRGDVTIWRSLSDALDHV